MQKNHFKKIKSLRNKLNRSVIYYGLYSQDTRRMSLKINKLINEYYKTVEQVRFPKYSNMPYLYDISYKALKIVTQQMNKFPTVQEWNAFAKENHYLSNVSLEYISNLDWNYLRVKILRELNMKYFSA